MKSTNRTRNRKTLATVMIGLGTGLLVACFFLSQRVSAVNRTWDNGGGADQNWSNPLNWSGDTVPGSGDIAVFDASSGNSTIDGAFAGTVGGIQINVGFAGTITQSADLTVGTSGFTQNAGTFNASSGSLQLQGSLLVNAATFTPNGGTVVFNGGGNQSLSLPASFTLNNVTVNKPSNTVLFFASGATNLVIGGTLTLTDGGLQDNTGVSTFNAQGPVSIASTFDGGSGLLLISGAATRTITLPVGAGIPRTTVNAANVTLDTSGAGTVTFGQPFAVTNCNSFTNGPVNFVFAQAFTLGTNFTLGSGNATFGSTYTQTGGTFSPSTGIATFNSNFSLTGGTFNAPSGTMALQASFTLGAGATFVAGSGTLLFNGGGNQPIDAPSGTLNFNNLTVNKSANSVLFFNSGAVNLVIQGTLTLTDGGIQDNTSVSTFNAQGSISIASTFDGGSAPLSLTGTANQTYTNAGGINPSGTWTINKSSGSVTLASNLILGTSQALNLTSGTLDLGPSFNLISGALTIGTNGVLRNFGTGNITLGGNLSNSGLVNINGGGAGCSDPNLADLLLIQSTDTNSRTWSGTGTFSLVDVEVDRQTVGATPGSIIAFGSSHLTNTSGFVLDAGCPVQITSNPTDQGGCPGGPVTFTVGASGTGLTFQWRKNTNNLNNGGNITGATTTTLSINPTTAGDVGSYDAVVTSTLGITATSNAALLNLLAAPQITQSPSDATRCEGQSVTFNSNATGDGLSFQWRKNLNPIGGATGNNFTIPTVVAGDAGSYDVVVTGTCTPPVTSAPAVLTVNTAPAITQEPTNQTACETGTATFTVGASGSNLTFQWRKNSVPLVNSSHISGANTPTLTINSVVLADADTYDVVVSGSCNPSVTSQPRTLTVNSGTTISQQPTDNTVCEGATATFTAASSDATATVQWQVSTDNGANFTNVPGATSTTLSFTAANGQNGHKFRAVFNGACTGANTNAATLTVNPAPSIGTQPTSQTVCDGGSATFTVAASGSKPSSSKRAKGRIRALPVQPSGLTYQWRRNNVPLSNGGNTLGADTPTLTINPATAADIASYDVVVSGSCTPPATSNPVTLSVDGFALSGTSQDFPLAGGNGSVNVITAASCGWTASSNDSFIHITSGSNGTGNGAVNFSVDAAVTPRSGTMTIANKTFTVNQTGVASVIISEFRFHGIAGPLDEFIEIYNTSNSVADISGYTIFALNAGGTPTLVFTVPGTLASNTTVIPARGHYLVANNSVGGYSLSVVPNGTYTADIVDGSGIGLFAGPAPAANNRADSTGFDTRDALFFETAPLTPAGGITTDGELSFVRLFLTSNGEPQDTNDNAADFLLVNINGGLFNGKQSRLGSPGPENLASPILRNTSVPASLVDPLVAPASQPNRERNLTPDPVNNSSFGTLAIRRRFTNNTGQNISQLRFRIMDITTFPSPGAGTADLRARTSVDSVVTVTGGGSVTVRGLTLDAPAQLFGGGYNSTLRAGVITLGAPLAPGASIDVEFLLGVQATGQFRFFVNIEALNAAAP